MGMARPAGCEHADLRAHQPDGHTKTQSLVVGVHVKTLAPPRACQFPDEHDKYMTSMIDIRRA